MFFIKKKEYRMIKRSAFTMIELIFAIVVIAITVMSLPMMSQVISKGVEGNIIQEAIFAAATELNEATTVHWDEASIDKNSSSDLAKVIDVGDKCEDDQTSSRYRLRNGHILEELHRQCLNNLDVEPAKTDTDENVTAIEDLAHNDRSIFINPDPSSEGYKADYQSELIVNYDPIFNKDDGNDSNIKEVVIKIKDSDSNLILQLTTYLTNIGEIDYYKRTY